MQTVFCDAAKIFEVTRHVLAPNPECIITEQFIDTSRWEDFV